MEPKRLCKSSSDAKISGVCGGIAEYLNVDPTVVRLIWVCLGCGGVGIIAYIAAMFIMPNE